MPIKVSSSVLQRGSYLKIKFNVTNVFDGTKRPVGELMSKPFDIDNLAQVWFKFSQTLPLNYSDLFGPVNPISVNILTKLSNSILSTIYFTNTLVHVHIDCKVLNFSQQWVLCTEEFCWKQMGKITGKCDGKQYELEPFDVVIIVSKKEIVTFAKLYHDTDFTDFDLSTSEGSVSVHKACLVAHSDVFRAMLSHEWKETSSGSIKIQGVTLETLRDLKSYIYLNTLPEKDEALRPLLILASYYCMDILVTDCIRKLAQMVTSKNLQSLLEYACAYNIPELTFALIEQAPAHVVHHAQLNRTPLNQDLKEDLKEDSKEDSPNNQNEVDE